MAALNTRSLVITIGGTDYTTAVSKAVITSADSDRDFVTFADAAAGGARDYVLEFTAAQDMATATLWRKVWSSPGTTVAVIVKPYGNATPSTSQPHYSANATIKEPDGDFIGGEADASVTARQVIECKWPLDAKPTEITA